MIEDKKIEDAKEEIYKDKFLSCGEMVEAFKDEDVKEMFDKEDIKEAIVLGAKWAINEFLKNLWHHKNEIPEIGRVIIMENYYPDGRIEFPYCWRKSTSHNPIKCNTKKWLYVDDLLPNGTNVIFKEVKE